jgi:hypothetical protein
MIYAASPRAVLLSEHRPVACVPSGHSVRCDLRMFNAVKLRSAHRLKVYVPMRLANRCLPTEADSSTSLGMTGVAPDEFA